MIRTSLRSVGPYTAALAMGLSFGVLLFSFGYSIHHQRQVNHKLCQQTVDNREGIRRTWDAARPFVLQQTHNPRATNEFFNTILETIPPLECIDNKPVVKEE